ncbi:MAG: porin, partial [bacterium]|nr:porin [bacterium]
MNNAGKARNRIRLLVAAVLLALPIAVGHAQTEREKWLEEQVQALLQRVDQLESRLQQVEGQPQPAQPAGELADATGTSKPTSNELTWQWKNGLSVSSEDGAYQFKVGGRIHSDWYMGSIDDGDFPDGTRFRRARINLSGRIYEDIEFRTEYDFTGDGGGNFKDVYMGYTGWEPASLRIGYMKEPFGLEQLTSANDIPFMERGLTSSLLSTRETGLMIFDEDVWDQRITWAVGVYKNTNNFGDGEEDDLEDGNWDLTARLTGLPWYEDEGRKLLHLGVAGSHRDWSDEPMRLRSRGTFSRGDYLIDTATFNADTFDLLGAEAALVYGPASLQAEYFYADVDPTFGGSQSIHAYYVMGSFFLTGVHRPYKAGIVSR